jgi:hypothetical protein
MHPLAVSFVANGIDGFFLIVAALCFLIAAVIAWFVAPRNVWAVLVAAGLLFWVLTGLIS